MNVCSLSAPGHLFLILFRVLFLNSLRNGSFSFISSPWLFDVGDGTLIAVSLSDSFIGSQEGLPVVVDSVWCSHILAMLFACLSWVQALMGAFLFSSSFFAVFSTEVLVGIGGGVVLLWQVHVVPLTCSLSWMEFLSISLSSESFFGDLSRIKPKCSQASLLRDTFVALLVIYTTCFITVFSPLTLISHCYFHL